MEPTSAINILKLKTFSNKAIRRSYQQLLMPASQKKRLVFVMGAQRSGTTMFMSCLGNDIRTHLYSEVGLSVSKTSRRLRPYDEIVEIISRSKSYLQVVKPLVEAQNTAQLLTLFTNAQAVWMYRDYKSVARSNLIKWGAESALRNIRPFAKGNLDSHWASENASAETAAAIQELFSEEMAPNDASACFWYARNKLYLDLALEANPRAILCKYEDLIENPKPVLEKVYQFFEYPYPGDHVFGHIHSRSVGAGASFDLSPAVDRLCANLQQELDALYYSGQKSTYKPETASL